MTTTTTTPTTIRTSTDRSVQHGSPAGKAGLIAAGIAVLFGINAVAPAPLPQHFTVLMLSIVVGFYVIGKVHHALHTGFAVTRRMLAMFSRGEKAGS